MKQEITIQKEAGKVISGRERLGKLFESLDDGFYVFTIERKRNTRSLQQNAYLHAVVIPLVYQGLRDAGFDNVLSKDDAFKVIKILFLKKQVINPADGLLIEIPGESSSLTKLEFTDFIDAIIKWAAEYLNTQIPYPNEQMQLL